MHVPCFSTSRTSPSTLRIGRRSFSTPPDSAGEIEGGETTAGDHTSIYLSLCSPSLYYLLPQLLLLLLVIYSPTDDEAFENYS
jgi:hypothetical protein